MTLTTHKKKRIEVMIEEPALVRITEVLDMSAEFPPGCAAE